MDNIERVRHLLIVGRWVNQKRMLKMVKVKEAPGILHTLSYLINWVNPYRPSNDNYLIEKERANKVAAELGFFEYDNILKLYNHCQGMLSTVYAKDKYAKIRVWR